MKETPLPLTTPMVRATLEGLKTNTMRVVGFPSGYKDAVVKGYGDYLLLEGHGDPPGKGWRDRCLQCPYGGVGDRLWVKEVWLNDGTREHPVLHYRADETTVTKSFDGSGLWKPPMFMFRWASRLTLEITKVRVLRVQDIHPDDCRREGIIYEDGSYEMELMTPSERDRRRVEDFRKLWDSINAKRPGCSWADNPWCWSLGYKVVK